MTNQFIQRCDELTKQISELEIKKGVAKANIQNAIADIKGLVDEFNACDVPVIDGEKVINFKIDADKLSQSVYTKHVCEKIPEILNHLEEVGTALINKALVR